jgi:hypothetical protein
MFIVNFFARLAMVQNHGGAKESSKLVRRSVAQLT